MTDLLLREKLQRKERELEVSQAALREAEEQLQSASQLHQAAVEAHGIAEELSREIQQKTYHKIAGVVTKCLQVFDDPYEFQILFEKKRNQTEARLALTRRGMEVDPMDSVGGGVVDVVSFAIRIACIVLSKPAIRKVIVLDEPFRFVSVEYRDSIRELLESISRDLGIQIIMVTHIPELVTGKVIRLAS